MRKLIAFALCSQVRSFCAVCSSADPLLAAKYLTGANGDLNRAVSAFLIRTEALTKSPPKRKPDAAASLAGAKKPCVRTHAQGAAPPEVIDDASEVVTIADSSDEGEGGQEDRRGPAQSSDAHPPIPPPHPSRSVLAASVEAFDRAALSREAAALLGEAFSLSRHHLEEAAAATEECWGAWRAAARAHAAGGEGGTTVTGSRSGERGAREKGAGGATAGGANSGAEPRDAQPGGAAPRDALSLLSGARDAAGGAGRWRDAEFPAQASSVDGGTNPSAGAQPP